MQFDNLKSILSTPIVPEMKSDVDCKLASVLIVIYGENPTIIMTEKPKTMKFHAGEISFPGGKFDQNDSTLLDTALRETREEIGLNVSKNDVIGQLAPVQTLTTKFLILPFVSMLKQIPPLVTNSEVEKILHIPLTPFLQTFAIDSDPSHNLMDEMYTFEYENQIVWGASARILKQIENTLRFI